jgi:hypothetical protein
MLFWLMPFDMIAECFVIGRNLHQTQVRIIVPVYIDQSDQHLLHPPLSPSHAAPAAIITTGRMLSLSMALPPNRIAVTAAIVMMFTNAFMLYSSITHSCFL